MHYQVLNFILFFYGRVNDSWIFRCDHTKKDCFNFNFMIFFLTESFCWQSCHENLKPVFWILNFFLSSAIASKTTWNKPYFLVECLKNKCMSGSRCNANQYTNFLIFRVLRTIGTFEAIDILKNLKHSKCTKLSWYLEFSEFSEPMKL